MPLINIPLGEICTDISKNNCAPRELNYIFEKFLWRLLSISNIAFRTWSELRVISCLTDTKAKAQGQSWICFLMFLGQQRFVGSLDKDEGETPRWQGGEERAMDFASEDNELQFWFCLCPFTRLLTISLRPRVLLCAMGDWYFPHCTVVRLVGYTYENAMETIKCQTIEI